MEKLPVVPIRWHSAGLTVRRAAFALLLALLWSTGSSMAPHPVAASPSDVTDTSRVLLPVILLPAQSPPTPPPTSADLIDAALARQEIDAETALRFKVFASFGDARLPASYRGAGDELDTILLQQVAGQFATLSPATQAALAPFFQPPVYQTSWYANPAPGSSTTQTQPATLSEEECPHDPGPSPIVAGGWGCIDSGLGANFRVWWRLDEPLHKLRADKIAQAMQNDIWPKLAILMRRDPPSDKGPHRFTGIDGNEYLWGDGGSGRLDIYVVKPPSRTGGAATIAYPPGCDLRPSFVLVDPNLDEKTLLPALAHEFFHTFQFGMDQKGQCSEWEWWSEATANWAVDFVYPDDNWEHQWAYYYLQRSGWRYSIFDGQAGGRSSYLLPFFLTHHLNDPGVIRRSWENAATSPNDSLAGIDQAVGGQLTDLWHEYAKALPNEPPFDRWRTWDQLDLPVLGDAVNANRAVVELVGRMPDGKEIEKHYEPVELAGGPDMRFDLPTAIPPLATRAYRYRFADALARSVAFTNPLLFQPLPEDAKVLAFYRVAGQDWKHEDWTTKPVKTFCRDVPEQRLDELIIVISNGQWRNRSQELTLAPDPLLAVTNIGCARWEGTFETEVHLFQPGTDVTDLYRGTVVFEPRTDLPDTFHDPFYAHFVTIAASVTWEKHGVISGCEINGGPTTYSAPADYTGNLEVASFGVDKLIEDYRVHTGVISLLADGVAQVDCPGNSYTEPVAHNVIATLGQGTKPITADGLTLQGRHAETAINYSMVTTWKFTAKAK